MDTLTFLMQILNAIVEGAKLVIVIVAFVLLGFFFKYIPLKLRKFMPRLAATAFVITLAGANCEQYFTFLTICWNRLGAIIFMLSGSVTMMLILFTVVLVTAIIERKAISYELEMLFEGFGRERNATLEGGGVCSNSFLAMTPVLLS